MTGAEPGWVHFKKNGKTHKPNGPASVYQPTGYEVWFLYGKQHRYYGPNAEPFWHLRGDFIK